VFEEVVDLNEGFEEVQEYEWRGNVEKYTKK